MWAVKIWHICINWKLPNCQFVYITTKVIHENLFKFATKSIKTPSVKIPIAKIWLVLNITFIAKKYETFTWELLANSFKILK